eukprot:6783003-Pyramimonas_sp.AAC.1
MPGAKRGGATGRAFLPFLSWAGQRRKLQEDVIIHENVESFDPAILGECLPMYHVFSVLVGPDQLGWPVRRTRRITVMVHKTKVRVGVQGWGRAHRTSAIASAQTLPSLSRGKGWSARLAC